MKRLKEEIIRRTGELVEEVISGTEIELVEVEFLHQHRRMILRVYIDKPGGVNINDCKWVSERLSDLLDIEDFIHFNYYLEVSSPGLTRPLKKESDYVKYQGRLVKIKTKEKVEGRNVWLGEIMKYEDKIVYLKSKDGKDVKIPYEKISSSNLEIDYP